MSNGVEVIVRGHKTPGHVGFEKTPWLPQKVNPSRPVTLPGHTVSRQFHLKDNPGKMANGIGQLLQSIVRSATPDLVTKTMLTTFTYRTTILKRTNTIIKSHEEVVSNVMTQRFQSLVKVTPTEHPATTTLPPDLMLSFLATSPYVTDTAFTTYIYYNTFTVGGLPMVLTSRETVSNVVTLPAYLAPTAQIQGQNLIRSTPAFETETHYSTYTFSKTVKDKSSEKVVTTRETVTQVVVTEGLAPVKSSIHPPIPASGITYFTTFTHLQTQLGSGGELVVRTSTSIESSVLKGHTTLMGSSFNRPGPITVAATIAQTKTLTPVMLYATKVYYTTYTYFTTHRHKDTETPPKVDSRTQVVSRVVTEALQTAFELSYVNQLKSSYLAKHSTLLDVTSSVEEIIPTRTIDVMDDLLTGSSTLVTQQVTHPHWPKDDEQLTVEIEPSIISSGVMGVTGPGERMRPKPPMFGVVENIPLRPMISRPPVISSSEEHFDEVKEGVHKIVSVLTNTNTRLPPGAVIDQLTFVRPTRTQEIDHILPRPTAVSGTVLEFEDLGYAQDTTMGQDAPDAFVEEVTLPELDLENDFTSVTELGQDNEEGGAGGVILTERPVSHFPTPPLTRIRTSTERSEPTSKGPLKVNPNTNNIPSFTNKIPIMDQNVELDMFPDIGPKPVKVKPSILVDYPHDVGDYDFPDDDDSISLAPSMTSSSSSTTSKWLDKRTGSATSSSGFQTPVNPTKDILSLILQMTDKDKDVDVDLSDEEEQPPKIYSIPSTFDTEAFNQQKKEQNSNSKTNSSLIASESSTNSTETDVEAEAENPSTEYEPDQTTQPEITESEEEAEADSDDGESTTTAEVIEEIENSIPSSNFSDVATFSNSSSAESDLAPISEDVLDLVADGDVDIAITTTPSPDDPQSDLDKDSITNTTSNPEDSDEISNTEPPTPIEEIVEKLESQPSSQLDDLFNSEELAFISTGFPSHTTTRYTTSKRPGNKKTSPRPYHPFGHDPASGEEGSGESSTHVYALGPVRFPSTDSSEEESFSEDEDKKKKRQKNKGKNKNKIKPSSDLNRDSQEDDESSESDEDKNDKKRRKSPYTPISYGGGGGGYSGPSKSSISFPVAAAGVGAGGTAIATAATHAFNWKPLLGLGAVGLGGLGASTLTKLGPLFNSVAGYMKGAILPISRNDTQHGQHNKMTSIYQNPHLHHHLPKKSEKARRPYYQLPPLEESHPLRPPPHGLSEPIYIPLGGNKDDHHQNNVEQNYRFTDEGIIRRPVLTHAQEPNFRPLANGREPDFVSGPLPPPILHSFDHDDDHDHGGGGILHFPSPDQSFPPKHNYNFIPPNDNLPNIFTEQKERDRNRESSGGDNGQPSLHKHGDPSPGPFLEENDPGHHQHDDHDDGPEGKTGFVLRPLQNIINGKPPFGNTPQRPGWVTPVLRPTPHDVNVNKPPGQGQNNIGLGPIYKPRPGPASIEMINEIKDSHSPPHSRPSYDDFPNPTPQIFLPQRNKPNPNQNPNNFKLNLPPRPPQGPLRINIPGLNLHSSENDLPNPWLPKTPQGHERFNENPFKDGGGPPHLTKNKNPDNAASSHESFESHFIAGEPPKPPAPSPPIMVRPEMRPISPFHRPPIMMEEFHPPMSNQGPNQGQTGNNKYFEGEGGEKFRPEDHQSPTTRPPFKPMSVGYFDFDPPKFNLAEGHGSSLEMGFPGHYNKGQNQGQGQFHHNQPPNPARLPPWPGNGPGPGQLPGRFPSPMNIFDAPELKKQNSNGNTNQNVQQNGGNNNIQRIVDPPHIIRRPPQPPSNPPSTVYIVEEQLHEDDDFDENQNFIKNHKFGNKNPFEGENMNNHRNFNNYSSIANSNSDLPPLVIKEVTSTDTDTNSQPGLFFPKFKSSTPPTSTPSTTTISTTPFPINTNTTNRALISRLFIRRFTTTTPRPSGSQSSTPYVTRVLPPWASKPKAPQFPGMSTSPSTTSAPSVSTSSNPATNLMNDLLNFEERFKQKYGPRKNSGPGQPAGAASSHNHVVDDNHQNHQNHNHGGTGHDEDEELNVSIYSEELDSNEQDDGGPHNMATQPDRGNINNHQTAPPNVSDHDLHPNHHPIHKPPIDVTKYLKDVDEDEFGQLYQGTEDKDTVIDPVNHKIIKSPHNKGQFHIRKNTSNPFQFMRRTTAPPLTDEDDDSDGAGTTEHYSHTLSASQEDAVLKKFTVPEDLELEFTSTPPANSKLWWPTTFRPKNGGALSFGHDTPTTYRPSNRPEPSNNDLVQTAASNSVGVMSENSQRPSGHPRPAPQNGMASFYDDEDSMGQIKMKNSEIHKLPTFIKRPIPGSGIALVKPEELAEYEKSNSGQTEQDDIDREIDREIDQAVQNIRETLNKEADQIQEYPEFPEGESYEKVNKPTQQPQPPTKNLGGGGIKTTIQVVQPPRTSSPSNKNQSSTLVVVTTSGGGRNPGKESQLQIQVDQEGPGGEPPGSNGHRESSYIYEEEYYDEDGDEDDKSFEIDNAVPPPPSSPQGGTTPQGKIVFFPKAQNKLKPKPTPPTPSSTFHHIAGHRVNSNPGHFPRLPLHNMVRFPNRPQPHPLPQPGGNGLRIFHNQPNVPKTEMEPPPIDSNRLKAPILELPSSGPIRTKYRPSSELDEDHEPNLDEGDGNGIHRPNLLRPDNDLFAPGEKEVVDIKGISPTPTPTPPIIHTIASLDEFNKIVGTNTFTMSSGERGGSGGNGQKNNSKVNLEGSEGLGHPDNTRVSVSPVIKYTGGRLQTTTAVIQGSDTDGNSDEDEDDDYYEDTTSMTTPTIQPSRSSTFGNVVIQKTRGPGLSSKNATVSRNTTTTTPTTTTSISITNSSANIRGNIRTRPPLSQILRSTTTKSPLNLTSTTSKPIIRRPFIPTRGAGPNIVPWARRPQPSSTTILPKTTSTENSPNSSPPIPTRNRTVFSSTVNDRDRRPTTTVMVTTSNSSSSEAKKYSPPSIFPPFLRRPGGFGGGSSTSTSFSEEKRKVTTLVSRFVPTSRPTTTTPTSTTTKNSSSHRPPSIFQNATTTTMTSPTSGGSGSDEYEEYSYEEDVELTNSTGNGNHTIPNESRPNATTTTMSTSVSVAINGSVINPTRISGGFGPKWKNGFKANSTTGAKSDEVEVTVRYVTRSESITVTLTETELSTFTTSGLVQTQTILITRTIPPETLVSTIAGDVTLVNTLDITPTVVRTTVFSEPTRAPPSTSFVDTSSESSVEMETERSRTSTERVNLSGLVTKGKLRPGGNVAGTGSGTSGNILKRPVSPPTTPESFICPSNCTLNPNQNFACRSYANGTRSRCDCKPGYARMKAKYPCRPTFTYEMRLGINHMDGMLFDFKDLYNAATDGYLNFITITKEAIDKAFLATDIKRQFQGSEVIGINPIRLKNSSSEPKVNVDFLVQLTTNITEDRIKNHLIRTLRTANFSIGRTGVTSTRDFSDFAARDFNECDFQDYNDCSLQADCLNIRGSFSCQCKPGFKDKSGSKRKPGRDCQETSGCASCSFRGTCHKEGGGNKTAITCHCFKWYGGTTCQINLKFLLIAITGIGSVLFILVMLCGTLLCKRGGDRGTGGPVRRPERTGSGRFMRYRSPNSQTTLERTAIMHDSGSSDGRQSPHHILTHGHGHSHHHSFTPDSLLVDVPDPHKISGIPLPGGGNSRHHSTSDVNLINFSLRNVVLDSDRGMAVVIPRAKIKTPSRPPSTSAAYALNNSDMNIQSQPDLAMAENKLINYLDQNQNQSACGHASKFLSNENQLRKYSLQEQRKISQGALVSSGEAVSAIGGMRRRSTTALDPTLESTYSAYTKSVSEVRSYDETIRCAAKPATLYNPTDTASRASCYSCKPPSYCAYSESHGHTMGDKDGASTVYTTQGKLFRMAHHHQQDDASSTASSQ